MNFYEWSWWKGIHHTCCWQQQNGLITYHVDLQVRGPHQILLVLTARDVLEYVLKRVRDNTSQLCVIFFTCRKKKLKDNYQNFTHIKSETRCTALYIINITPSMQPENFTPSSSKWPNPSFWWLTQQWI